MIKTKIICTLGPAVDDEAVLRELITGGMNVARMNFSHGSHEEQLDRLHRFRTLCDELNAEIPVLLDTRGPEIRLGLFDEPVTLDEGQEYTLTTDEITGNDNAASVNYSGLVGDVAPNDSILIDDGLVELKVIEISGNDIRCKVLNSGVISARKSLNVPGVILNMPTLTEQDVADIMFAIEHDYDLIAVSFVRKRADIAEVRKILEKNGGKDIRLIAKIENRQGLDNLDDIINVSDGIMVARGDLGVEIPLEEIPLVQKEMIKKCYRAGKPVITATQMLDSMIRNPRPTRAEINDIANAIYDGTSAIMLSGETASGKYPIESLKTMVRVAKTTEQSIHYWKRFLDNEYMQSTSITSAISHATCTTAMDLKAAAIVAVTKGGGTARMISRFRPDCPIIAITTSKKALRQLKLSWGVYPYHSEMVASTDDLFLIAVNIARESGIVNDGDLIVVTAGVPVGISGATNMLKVQMVGNILCRGNGIGEGSATGALMVAENAGEVIQALGEGDILVIPEITDDIMPLIKKAKGLIVEAEDSGGAASTIALTLEIPVIAGVTGATQLLKSGTIVIVDAKHGYVQFLD